MFVQNNNLHFLSWTCSKLCKRCFLEVQLLAFWQSSVIFFCSGNFFKLSRIKWHHFMPEHWSCYTVISCEVGIRTHDLLNKIIFTYFCIISFPQALSHLFCFTFILFLQLTISKLPLIVILRYFKPHIGLLNCKIKVWIILAEQLQVLYLCRIKSLQPIINKIIQTFCTEFHLAKY